MCNRCLGLQGTWLAWKFPKKVKLAISLVERDTEDAHGVDGDDVGGGADMGDVSSCELSHANSLGGEARQRVRSHVVMWSI